MDLIIHSTSQYIQVFQCIISVYLSLINNSMSSSFKGVLSIIISALFFFPWVWMSILHIRPSALVALSIGLVATIIAVVLGYQARKGGSRTLGIAGLTLGVISIVLNVVNMIAIFLGRN